MADIALVDYATLARQLDGRVDFERLPSRPEPGLSLDAPYRAAGVSLGERFGGQTMVPRDGFDTLAPGDASFPLTLQTGESGRNLSVAHHRGFGSNALFPLGPLGFPAAAARGEGMVSVLFDSDQSSIGFRVHTDYRGPFGHASPPQGNLDIRFFDRSGRRIGRQVLSAPVGQSAHAFSATGAGPGIAGISILNTDPGGIAIDDLIYQRRALAF